MRHTEDLKDKVDRAMQDLVVASRIFDAFRNPQSGTTYLKDHASFPFEYIEFFVLEHVLILRQIFPTCHTASDWTDGMG